MISLFWMEKALNNFQKSYYREKHINKGVNTIAKSAYINERTAEWNAMKQSD